MTGVTYMSIIYYLLIFIHLFPEKDAIFSVSVTWSCGVFLTKSNLKFGNWIMSDKVPWLEFALFFIWKCRYFLGARVCLFKKLPKYFYYLKIQERGGFLVLFIIWLCVLPLWKTSLFWMTISFIDSKHC